MARDHDRLLEAVRLAAERVEAAEADLADARTAYRGAIRAAAAGGVSLTAIGSLLGVTRQRVGQLVDEDR